MACRRGGAALHPVRTVDNPNKLLSSVAAAMAQGKPIDLSRASSAATSPRSQIFAKAIWHWPRHDRQTFDRSSLRRARPAAQGAAVGHGAIGRRDPALLRFGAIPMRPGEPPISFGDNGKASRLLGWQPRPAEQMVDDLVAA